MMCDTKDKLIPSDVSDAPVSSQKFDAYHIFILLVYYVAAGISSFLVGYYTLKLGKEDYFINTLAEAALIGAFGTLAFGLAVSPLVARYVPLPCTMVALAAHFSPMHFAINFLRQSPGEKSSIDQKSSALVRYCRDIVDLVDDVESVEAILTAFAVWMSAYTYLVAGFIGYALVGAGRLTFGLQNQRDGLNWADAGSISYVGFGGGCLVHPALFFVVVYLGLILLSCARCISGRPSTEKPLHDVKDMYITVV